MLDAPASRDDMAVGEQLLRELIFVHLERGADKFALLILMLRKLYALVRPCVCCHAGWAGAPAAARHCMRLMRRALGRRRAASARATTRTR